MILHGASLEMSDRPVHETLLERFNELHAKNPENLAFVTAENDKDYVNFQQLHKKVVILSEWFVESKYKKVSFATGKFSELLISQRSTNDKYFRATKDTNTFVHFIFRVILFSSPPTTIGGSSLSPWPRGEQGSLFQQPPTSSLHVILSYRLPSKHPYLQSKCATKLMIRRPRWSSSMIRPFQLFKKPRRTCRPSDTSSRSLHLLHLQFFTSRLSRVVSSEICKCQLSTLRMILFFFLTHQEPLENQKESWSPIRIFQWWWLLVLSGLFGTNWTMIFDSRAFGEVTKAFGLPEDFVIPYDLHFLPMYHALGMFRTLLNSGRGSTQIIFTKFDMELMLKLVEKYSIMSLAMVPAILVRLVHSPLLQKYDLSSLTSISVGSAPLPEGAVQKLKMVLPNVKIVQGYGMTELTFASHLHHAESPPGSVGRLLPGTSMKVKKEDGTLCGVGEVGELWIKGPQMMKGYWRKESLSKELIDEEGYMRTGDLVYFDKNGDTFISDRIKELIKVNAKQVAPAELESVILEHDDVADVCVFGVDDATSGERPVACVVSKKRKDLETAKAIMQHINRECSVLRYHWTPFSEKLARYKHIKEVEFVNQIMRTGTGKILRRTMKKMFLDSRKARLWIFIFITSIVIIIKVYREIHLCTEFFSSIARFIHRSRVSRSWVLRRRYSSDITAYRALRSHLKKHLHTSFGIPTYTSACTQQSLKRAHSFLFLATSKWQLPSFRGFLSLSALALHTRSVIKNSRVTLATGTHLSK